MKITNSEYLQLLGLKTLAIKKNNELYDIKKVMMQIVKDDDVMGACSDLVFDDNTSVDGMLKMLDIQVLESKISSE